MQCTGSFRFTQPRIPTWNWWMKYRLTLYFSMHSCQPTQGFYFILTENSQPEACQFVIPKFLYPRFSPPPPNFWFYNKTFQRSSPELSALLNTSFIKSGKTNITRGTTICYISHGLLIKFKFYRHSISLVEEIICWSTKIWNVLDNKLCKIKCKLIHLPCLSNWQFWLSTIKWRGSTYYYHNLNFKNGVWP